MKYALAEIQTAQSESTDVYEKLQLRLDEKTDRKSWQIEGLQISLVDNATAIIFKKDGQGEIAFAPFDMLSLKFTDIQMFIAGYMQRVTDELDGEQWQSIIDRVLACEGVEEKKLRYAP